MKIGQHTVGEWMISFVGSALKVLNLVMGVAAIALTLYPLSLNMLQFGFLYNTDYDWFLTVMGLFGYFLCLVSVEGYVAPDIHDVAYLLLNTIGLLGLIVCEVHYCFELLSDMTSDSGEVDPEQGGSINYHLFKKFLNSNFNICKWIGLFFFSVQVLCFLCVMVLYIVEQTSFIRRRKIGPNGEYYDPQEGLHS